MRKLTALKLRDVKHLCAHLKCSREDLERMCADPAHYYRRFPKEIKGKVRPIAEPIGRLRMILNQLRRLLDRIELPDCVHGGVKDRSPLTNAVAHIRKPAVLKFDLEGFFPSVHPKAVYQMFTLRLKCKPDVARLLTRLVTLDGGLPQGSPTSTVVGNLVLMPLVARLQSLAEAHGSDYTQYVDDGYLSGPGYLERIRPTIERIIRQEGLRASAKPEKRTTRHRHEEQVVTGIRVDNGVDCPSEKISALRSDIRCIAADAETGRLLSPRDIRSLEGRINHVARLNCGAAKFLRRKLEAILS